MLVLLGCLSSIRGAQQNLKALLMPWAEVVREGQGDHVLGHLQWP